jgi:hypothetical protein
MAGAGALAKTTPDSIKNIMLEKMVCFMLSPPEQLKVF